MVKRSLVLVAMVLAVGLALAPAASADHPYAPPAWWTEHVTGGKPPLGGGGPDNCVPRHYVGSTPSGSSTDDWLTDCGRRYPGGLSSCRADARHGRTSDGQSVYRARYECFVAHFARRAVCARTLTHREDPPAETKDTGWVRREQAGNEFGPERPDPGCVEGLKQGRYRSDRDRDQLPDHVDDCPGEFGATIRWGCPSGKKRTPSRPSDDSSDADTGAGHDLVSLCGTARFDWYRAKFGEPDVEKGEEACLHTVSNEVARQLARDGLKKIDDAFAQRVVDWAKGKLVPDEQDVLLRALSGWDRALRAAGRANLIVSIGEAAGLAGVALGYTGAANHIANKDACVTFMTSMATNLTIEGAGGGSTFQVDGWQMLYNAEHSDEPIADVTKKLRRGRLRRDTWEVKRSSMRCGAGGKVFLVKKHDESAIVANRVRAVG